MKRGGTGNKGQLDKKQLARLRATMQQQDRTPEQIATEFIRRFHLRPRQAWRHAYGWTQEQVADRYNQQRDDKQASMSPKRISDYERWPPGRAKPTIKALAVLAKVYSTSVSKLVDHDDLKAMNKDDLIALDAVASSPPVVPRQLPSAAPNFVGRVHELQILTAQLDRAGGDGDDGPVVITSIGGTAGIGKTALAIYWARQHIDQFPDGQLYVDLRGFAPSGTPMTPQEAVRGFLDAFQIPVDKIPINPDTQATFYRNLVDGKRLVIVLDNARGADQVRPLLPNSPSCLVLVTSRQQLGSLIALKGATHITLDFLTTAEARQLLTEILEPERIHAESDAVDELIERCVHLPIALRIAAAVVLASPHLPLSTLVGELREQRQRLDALSTGDSQDTDIRAVFSWSYTALSFQAARLFRLLGLHPGPDIGTLAAASLAGLPEQDTHNLLVELTRAHLLKQHISNRYQFHDLLRVYATEKATKEEPEPQRRAALHRALDYYLHTSFPADRHLSPHRKPVVLEVPQSGTIPNQIIGHKQALEWFTAERAVLIAAIDHAATDGFDTHAWQLPWTLATFLNWRGHWHDQAAIQQTAVAAARRLDDRAAQAITHQALGLVHTHFGRYADARDYLQQTLALYQDLGDFNGQAHTHRALGWVCERQDQHTEALSHAQHALDLYRTADNKAGQARALNALGWDHALLGNYQQALTHCQQALNLYRKLGDHYGEAQALDSLGYAHHHLGHHDEAITHYHLALALRRELGDHYSEADTLARLGDTYHTTGDHSAARQTWQQALTILDQFDHPDAEQIRTKLADLDTDTNGC